MPILTPTEHAALQSQHPLTANVKWYMALAPYGDSTFTALVRNAGAAKGDRDIIYDTDVGELNVQAGMTLWVGTGAGLYDIGKVRIRSINTATNTITVAENDDIWWTDDLHLTCPGEAGFRELWGIYPRITEVGGVVTFFEDYDEVFAANPDDVIPPKANAGSPACGFLNDDGWVDISFAEDGKSFTTEIAPAVIVSYLWDFADGVIQVGAANQAGTCTIPNVVRFNSTGFRYVSLTVTDNTIRNRTGVVYVPVWIFDRPGGNAPPLSVELLDRVGDPHWQMRLKAFTTNAIAQTAFNNYPDGALCVVFSETEYPNASSNVGGVCHRSNIEFVGWFDAETLNFEYDTGTVEFTVISHDLRLSQLPGFAYTLEDDTPTDWWQIGDLNLDRALHVHLERKTTVNQVCHVERLGEGATRPISIQPFPDTSLYEQAQEHLLKDAMTSIIADRQGMFRVRRDPQFMGSAARDLVDVVCTLTAPDILNAVDESKPHQLELGYVRLGGFSYETPLLAQAPGIAPGQCEAATYTEGFIVISQLELNLWAGLWYKKENNPYKTIPVELSGYWPVFDPAFQEYVRLTLIDPLGRNPLTNQRFIVKQVTFRDEVIDGTTTTELVLEMETDILYGEFVEIPPPPPPEPPPPPPEVIITPIDPPQIALIHDRTEIYATADFQNVSPTWVNITGGIIGVIMSVEMDQYDRTGAWAVSTTDGVSSNDEGINEGLWRTNDVTVGVPVWFQVFSQNDGKINRRPYNDCSTGAAEPTWGQLRSLTSIGPGEALIAESRRLGLLDGRDLHDTTSLFRVDKAGAWALANDDVMCTTPIKCGGYPPTSNWCFRCGFCGSDAPHHHDANYARLSLYVAQAGNWISCNQLAIPQETIIGFPCGAVNEWCEDYCTADPPNCRVDQPIPYHPHASDCLRGATHIIRFQGVWWAQSVNSELVPGVTDGAVYNSSAGEVDDGMWSSFGFCNLTSNPEHIYWCKKDALISRRNNLYQNGVIVPGVDSNVIFGAGGGGLGGIIGHLRCIWDEDRTIVMVRKEEPAGGQVNKTIVWTWDEVNGVLRNKTGTLGNVWKGTGDTLGGVWNDALDNVGFSAFGVPLR